MTAVSELFERLSGDPWRIRHPFSDDMLQANALLHNPAATEDESSIPLNGIIAWLFCFINQDFYFFANQIENSKRHIGFFWYLIANISFRIEGIGKVLVQNK